MRKDATKTSSDINAGQLISILSCEGILSEWNIHRPMKFKDPKTCNCYFSLKQQILVKVHPLSLDFCPLKQQVNGYP